jgi:sterol desaturase/sphingolipid hydroxylase (fatty acid hydroxylase superfamily)
MALGGSHAMSATARTGVVHLGLDWFMLNLVFTGILFVPLERVFGRRPQPLFRTEWREDLFYFLVSSLLVQALTYLSLAPSMAIRAHTQWAGFRAAVGAQAVWLQVVEIMFLTDLVQYWVHRAFHRSAVLWRFHAVHHSAPVLDWLAGSRMHVVEIVCLRGATVIPMYVLGFGQAALYTYLVFVYVYATYIHSNVRFDVEWLKPVIVTPRFHHWHHGLEREAVDVNFAIHFPILDRLFGTYHMPVGRWPQAYGVSSEPVPHGYLRQLAYPFGRRAG